MSVSNKLLIHSGRFRITYACAWRDWSDVVQTHKHSVHDDRSLYLSYFCL